MSWSKSPPQDGKDHVQNDPNTEAVLHADRILQIIRTAGWPNANLSHQEEMFSVKGWLSRFSIALNIATVDPSKTRKRSFAEVDSSKQIIAKKPTVETSFSSLMAEMPPPPRPPQNSRSQPLPQTSPTISIRISYLRNLKASLKYMDEWLTTFSNRRAFTPCHPSLGHRSLSKIGGIYWIHNRCFIQLENETLGPLSTRTADTSRLRTIATEFDKYLRSNGPQRLQSKDTPVANKQPQSDASTLINSHTYPEVCILKNPSHYLTINLPTLLRLLIPSTDRHLNHLRFQLLTLENGILQLDETENIFRRRADGLFGFTTNEGKSGKEVIVFLVGNSEKYLVWMVKIEVLVLEEREETEIEKAKREVAEKEWELSLAEGGCLMVDE